MGRGYTIGAKLPGGQTKKCGKGDRNWVGCEKHTFEIEYDDSGNYEREGSEDENGKIELYPGNWDRHNRALTNIGLVECEKGNIELEKDEKTQKTRVRRIKGRICRGHYEETNRDNFPIQKHHVIPVKAMAATTALKENLKLMGWDINDGESNGLCMPYNYEDMKRYDLQVHRGGHKKYNSNVKKALKSLDISCEQFCKDDNQDELHVRIYMKVTSLRKKLIKWQWVLHSASKDERKKYNDANYKLLKLKNKNL